MPCCRAYTPKTYVSGGSRPTATAANMANTETMRVKGRDRDNGCDCAVRRRTQLTMGWLLVSRASAPDKAALSTLYLSHFGMVEVRSRSHNCVR